MSVLSQRYKTLGELTTELRARLSMVAHGASAGYNMPVLMSFLQRAHEYIYAELDPTPARKITNITIEQGGTIYDWHNDVEDEYINPGNVLSVWCSGDTEERVRMTQGITIPQRAEINRSQPTQHDTLNGQCEIYPIPDRSYQMFVEYIADQPRFTQQSDRPGVPDGLVLLLALANAKTHYRHPDAQAALAEFNNRLRIQKTRQKENKRFFVNSASPRERTVTVSDGRHTFRTD